MLSACNTDRDMFIKRHELNEHTCMYGTGEGVDFIDFLVFIHMHNLPCIMQFSQSQSLLHEQPAQSQKFSDQRSS